MVFKYSLLFLVLLVASTAHAGIDCDEVPGQWQGERFEESLDAERSSIITFYADGRFRFEFHTFNEAYDEHTVDTGRWVCVDNRITFADALLNGTPSGLVHTYEILELDSTYFVFKLIAADCSKFVGDCEGVIYGLTRMPDGYKD
jgi:hypothetical protein